MKQIKFMPSLLSTALYHRRFLSMFQLGRIQTLFIVKQTDFGVYLAETKENVKNKVLLPKAEVPENAQINDSISVFLYKDSEDRLIATTKTPALTIGKLAYLPVRSVTEIGVFLDWGLPKDLLLPFQEQTKNVKEGEFVLVSLYVDRTDRLCATMKVYPFLSCRSPYQKDDFINGIIYEIYPTIGAYVAVDSRYSALLPARELSKEITVGKILHARIASVLEDGKLNLTLREKKHLQIDTDASSILQKLKEANGFLPFHDHSDPTDIQETFGFSKSAFKRAVGHLLKQNLITLSDQGISLK